MKTLEKRIALVTGGSRSLGRHTAIRLAEEGADVCITYKTQAKAAADTVAELESKGVRAVALQLDLSSAGALDEFVPKLREVLSAWGDGKLDILINNAGIISHSQFPDVTEAELDAQFDVNYKSAFFLTQRLLGDLRDGGRILFVGSGTTRFSIPALVAYGPIKAAVEVLARYLAKDLGPRGITVNAVSPGALETDFNRDVFDAAPQMRGFIASQTAGGRVGETDDVVGVTAFLCGDEARWITGQRIEISGGIFL